MLKLKLKFNDSFEFVKLVLSGEGSYVVDEKKEHVDVICQELTNFILHERPDVLEFDGYVNYQLLSELDGLNVKFDELSKKLSYYR